MNTFEEFTERLHSSRPSCIREGQHAFNVLYEMKPKLADQIRGTEFDPFHICDRLSDFLDFVEKAWSD